MKSLMVFTFIVVSFFSGLVSAKDSTLVDVDKDSKLSDYFKKINKKMSDDPEEKSLIKDKVEASEEKISLAEEDILLPEATRTKKSTSDMSPVNKMMVAIIGLLFVVGLSFGGLHKMGKKKGYTSIAQNIKILTQKSIGPKKNLMLIRVAGETILLGVTDHNINHIKTLSLMEDELPGFTEPRFSNQLKNKIEQTKITDEVEEVDGFSVSRLDDVKRAVTERFSI